MRDQRFDFKTKEKKRKEEHSWTREKITRRSEEARGYFTILRD